MKVAPDLFPFFKSRKQMWISLIAIGFFAWLTIGLATNHPYEEPQRRGGYSNSGGGAYDPAGDAGFNPEDLRPD